jgi:serine/threonine-protein kinase
MASPKKPLPEHVPTTVAPGGGQPERRTAALPNAPVPTATPNARTMMFDTGAALQKPRAPMPTIMTSMDSGEPRRPSQLGRWIGGPAVAMAFAVLTLWIAGMAAAGSRTPKNTGKLRLSSDPEGATVLVEGKVHPQPTPTTIDGEVGATLRLAFRLDGYLEREADVFVGEGERPFRAKLERREFKPPTDPEPPPPPEPSLAPPPVLAKDPPRPKKDPVRRVAPPTSATPIAPVMLGTGTLSVRVRPWAIVYVDGAKIRQTPLDGHTLTAGLHVVELVNDGLKKKEKVTVEVRANGSEEIRRDWEK